LLSLEFATKSGSLSKAINIAASNPNVAPGLFWTSGFKVTTERSEWCAVGRTVLTPQWAPGEPSGGEVEKCLAADASPSSVLLTDQDCAKELRYICEVLYFQFSDMYNGGFTSR